MLYLYAIVDGPVAVDDIVGVSREALQTFQVESMTVISGVIETPPPIDRSMLAAQDRVVRTLHERTAALLPMRFGSIFQSESDAARAIELQTVRLREQLNTVRGREQMTMRVLSGTGRSGGTGGSGRTGGAGGTGGAGAEYLRARAERQVPAEIAPLLAVTAHLARGTRVERPTTSGMIATVYQLVDRGASDAYRAAVATAPDVDRLSVHVTGPSPCYAFA
jgi:hypothetical protein